jgi:hypothetical protein
VDASVPRRADREEPDLLLKVSSSPALWSETLCRVWFGGCFTLLCAVVRGGGGGGGVSRTLARLDDKVHMSAFQIKHGKAQGASPGFSSSLTSVIDRFVSDCVTSSSGVRDGDQHRWVVLLTDMTGRTCADDFSFVCRPTASAAPSSSSGSGALSPSGLSSMDTIDGVPASRSTAVVPEPGRSSREGTASEPELGPEDEPRMGIHGFPTVCVWPNYSHMTNPPSPAAHVTNIVSFALDVKRTLEEQDALPAPIRQPFQMLVTAVCLHHVCVCAHM